MVATLCLQQHTKPQYNLPGALPSHTPRRHWTYMIALRSDGSHLSSATTCRVRYRDCADGEPNPCTKPPSVAVEREAIHGSTAILHHIRMQLTVSCRILPQDCRRVTTSMAGQPDLHQGGSPPCTECSMARQSRDVDIVDLHNAPPTAPRQLSAARGQQGRMSLLP